MFNETLCSTCPKCVYRHNRREGRGDINSERILVSDHPGKTEIATRKVLTGPAGQILWNTLALDGWKPEDFFCTNAVKCPVNDPKLDTIKHCRPYLVEELNRAVNKKLIIVAGSSAYQSLLSFVPGGVMKNCGKVYWSDEFNCWILCCINPAAVLHNEGRDFHLFRATMGKILNPVVELNVPLGRLTEDISLLEEWAGQFVAMDIETNSTLDYIDPNSRITSIGFCNGVGSLIYTPEVYDNPRFWEAVKKLKLITHNGSFDIAFIRQKHGAVLEITDDTMMMAYQLNETFGSDEEGGYSLEKLACIYLGVLPWKYLAKTAGYDHPEYLSKDTYYPWKLWEMWKPRMKPVYYNIFIPIMNVKSEIERGGMTFDFEAFKELRAQYQTETKELMKTLRGMADGIPGAYNPKARNHIFDRALKESLGLANAFLGDEQNKKVLKSRESKTKSFLKFLEWLGKKDESGHSNSEDLVYNPNSDPQNQVMFKNEFRRLQIPEFKLKATEKKDVVDILKRHGVAIDKPKGSDVWICERSPFFETYFTYAEKAHSMESFITDKWVRADGRVHTNIKAHGTATGRLSSNKPNIFNMPKKLRRLYKPDFPGWKWISIDYKQLEMMVAIALAKLPGMMEELAKGLDIHQVTSMWMSGLPVEEITSEIRRRAKEVNFGCIFGATAQTVAKYLSWGSRVCSVAEARDFMVERFGILEQWREELIETSLERGYTETVMGSRRRFFVVTKDNIHSVRNDIVNTTVQGSAAQMALLRLIEVVRELPSVSTRARVVNEVYDCIDLVCPVEEVEIVSSFTQSVMERAFDWTPLRFRVDVEVKDSWGK